jgi:hypothetical protein
MAKRYLSIIFFLLSAVCFSQTTSPWTITTTSSTDLTGNFFVPCGVTQITVRVWGGGGAGGGGDLNSGTIIGGGGGGAGAYSTAVINVKPGEAIAYVVGGRGIGGTGNGGNGKGSRFGEIFAAGGTGGRSATNGGTGGAGGTAEGGDTNTSGGTGATGNTSNGGVGGNASTGGAGGAGGGAGANGAVGGTPGGGGGGGGPRTGGSTAGGSGGFGRITVTWGTPAIACDNGTTSGTTNVCNVNWVDNGGTAANYANSLDYTRTFCSNVAGQCISMEFVMFDLEAHNCLYDFMEIWDGNSTSAPYLGKFCGTASPGTIASSISNASGCITVRFRSDGSVTRPGFSALITCRPCPVMCSTNSDCPSGQTCTNIGCVTLAPTPTSGDGNTAATAILINECGTSFTASNSAATANPCAANIDCNTSTVHASTAGNDVPWSIENDLYYVFCPSQTGTWNISVTGTCGNTSGYQMAVFQGTPTNLNTRHYVSTCQASSGINCTQSLTGTTSISVSVSSLSSCVYLVLDGHAGNVCTFNVTISTSVCNLVLPINLLDFSAAQVNDKVVLNWATASETHNDYFTVLKSYNGKDFVPVERVPGSGNSNSILKYTAEDYDLQPGLIYYQLKQTDYDGKSSLSQIVSVKISDNKREMRLFPNPVKHASELNFYADFDDEITINLIDFTGKVVHQQKNSVLKGNNQIKINLQDLSKGIYYLNIAGEREVTNMKVVKE